MVAFSIVQETKYEGMWRPVLEIDSRHGCVHRHQYARSTFDRVGPREVLKPIGCCDDVQDGYNAVIRELLEEWPTYKARWQDG